MGKMTDPFHEAKEALDLSKREYTSVGSLSGVAAYSINQACENSIRTLWEIATGDQFPHDKFTPFHKPTAYVRRMGLFSYYSSETQSFLNMIEGLALDGVRYENTQAYKDYTNPKNKTKGKALINGTENFINETIELSRNPDVLNLVGKLKND
jgi:hypothetical protein